MSRFRLIIDNFRRIKGNYHSLRKNYGFLLSRRLYSAVSGDIVDEQVAEYINNLNFEVPI